MNQFKGSLIKLGKTFDWQDELINLEMDHEEINEDIWGDLKDARLLFSKYDVLSMFFDDASYTMDMPKLTAYGLKDCLYNLSLRRKIFIPMKLRDGELKKTHICIHTLFTFRQTN